GLREACRPDSRMAIGQSCTSHTPSGGTGRPSRRLEPTKWYAIMIIWFLRAVGSRHQAATQDGHAILEYRQPRPIRNVARLAIRADLCPFALTYQARQGLVCAVCPHAAVSGVRTPRIPCLTLALAKD